MSVTNGGSEVLLARSILYIPGIRDDLMAKAYRMPADIIQLDLEDSVPLDKKDEARALVADFVRDWRSEVGHLLAVKINPTSEKTKNSVPCGFDDLAATFAASVDFVVIPKVESVEEVRALDEQITGLEREQGRDGGSTRIIAMIESAEGLVNIVDIARSSGRLFTLAYTGETDFNALLLVSPNPNPPDADLVEYAYGRQHTTIACLSAALAPPIDNVVLDVQNLDFLRSSSVIAKRLGFGGRLCINPKQVEVVNEVFSPSAEETEWAARVVEALEQTVAEGRGATVLDGRLVDIAMGTAAARVLAYAKVARARAERLEQHKAGV